MPQFLLWSMLLSAQQLRGRAYAPPRHASAHERALWFWLCTRTQLPHGRALPSAQGIWRNHQGLWPSRWARHIVLRAVLLTPGHAWHTQLKLAVGLLVLTVLVVTPLSVHDQWLFSMPLMALAWYLRPQQVHSAVARRLVSLSLILLSVLVMARYAYWRMSSTLFWEISGPGLVGWLILFAEVYFWILLLLGNFLLAWPLMRRSTPLPSSPVDLPHVDVFIPTYNEPLEVVRPTVLAALDLDWPADRLHVWILDDGRRPAFEAFAKSVQVGYIRRTDNAHAKAGNINHALRQTQSAFVAIFDCDHIPSRDFLTQTMGWMLKNARCALLQTPHHFFSQDPIERNLQLSTNFPNEGRLFHGLLQPGNDLWNAALFCGSCAVMRRDALDVVGGIATQTVTEDAHTALNMHRHGYETAFLNRALAAGLAPETLSSLIGQRMRWGRGMVQIARIDNPLLGPGLNWTQRLSYLNATFYFLHGLPRLILLVAPLAYPLIGSVMQAGLAETLAYVLPYIFVSRVSELRLQSRHRGFLWGDVYEVLLSWFLLKPTLLALINPASGKFNVTSKGDQLPKGFFDWHSAWVYLALAGVNAIPVVFALQQLDLSSPTITMAAMANGFWALFNFLLIGVTLHVASERRQVRTSPRVNLHAPLPVTLQWQGLSQPTQLLNFSFEGVALAMPQALSGLQAGDACQILLSVEGQTHTFPATVQRVDETIIGLALTAMSDLDQTMFLRCTFARSQLWETEIGLSERQPRQDLQALLGASFKGYVELVNHLTLSVWGSLRRPSGPQKGAS